jgi:hypothetical protein
MRDSISTSSDRQRDGAAAELAPRSPRFRQFLDSVIVKRRGAGSDEG